LLGVRRVLGGKAREEIGGWRLAPHFGGFEVDQAACSFKNYSMSIDSESALKELEATLARAPDQETMQKACEEMDRLREETLRRVGMVNVADEYSAATIWRC